MNFRLTDEQQMLRQSASAFLRETCPPARVRALIGSDQRYDADLWQAMTRLGWPGLIVPACHGGTGLGPVEFVVLMQELGYALAPVPFLSTVLAGWCVSRGGSEAIKKRRLATLCDGTEIGALAWMEDAGWDPDALALRVEPMRGGMRLDGRKRFVTDAAVADWFVVSGREGHRTGLYVVDARARGVTIEPLDTVDPTRHLGEVRLDGVQVGPDDRLEGGRALLASALDLGRVGLAAEMVGGAARVVELSVDYARTRVQFDGPIGRFQAVQHRCVDMCVQTEAMRSLVYYAACRLRDGHPEAPLAAAMAKAAAADAYPRVACDGIQVHGGIGFTWEHDLHLYLKRAKADELMFGDAEFNRERVAEALAAGVAEEDRHAG